MTMSIFSLRIFNFGLKKLLHSEQPIKMLFSDRIIAKIKYKTVRIEIEEQKITWISKYYIIVI